MGLATLFEPDAWMPAEVRLNYRNSASSAPHRGVQEAMVAINPSDPKNVLVFGMDFNVRNDNPDVYAASRLFRSVDGGRTWTDEGILPFDADAPAPTRPSGDPVVIFDRDGMAHVAALSASEGQRGIHVRSSNDGGQTWSSPIIAVADVRNTATNDCRGTDKEMLGSDASTHRLYLTFTWFIYDCSLPSYEYGTLIGKTRAEVWMSTSDDRGRSWAAPVRLRDSYAIGSVPRVGPDGTLYVVMYSTEKAPVGSACPSLLGTLFGEPFSAVAVMASKDGGNSWRTHLQGVCESTWMNVVQKRLGLPPVPILVTAPGLSVDPQTGDAYVAFLSYSYVEGRTSLFTMVSLDGGGSWSAPREVTFGVPRQTFLPAIVANGGRAWVQYMQMTGEQSYAAFVRQTTDKGATWSSPFRLSTDYDLGRTDDLRVGHYNWIDATGGLVGGVWAGGMETATDLWYRAGFFPKHPTI